MSRKNFFFPFLNGKLKKHKTKRKSYVVFNLMIVTQEAKDLFCKYYFLRFGGGEKIIMSDNRKKKKKKEIKGGEKYSTFFYETQ